jgi:tetratricopeptide (TPR) repeat protein
MKKALLLLLIAMILAGCATGHWTKPNFSNEEWRKDYYECDFSANMYCYRFTGAAAIALCRRDNMTRCLQARGYVYVKGSKTGSPDNASAGLAAENRGDYDEAIRLYTRAIEAGGLSRENLSVIYSNRGRVWLVKGNNDLAIADFNKAIELMPQYAEAYCYRGAAWMDRGENDLAIVDYNKAIELKPQYGEAYAMRGLTRWAKGDRDLAIADYNKAIELMPQSATVYRALAWHLAVCPESKYRDGVKAVELAKKAVELEDAAINIDTLAAAYAEAGRFQDAIKTQERAIAKLKEEENTRDLAEYEQHLASYKAGYPRRAGKSREELKYSEPPQSEQEVKPLEAPKKYYQREITYDNGSKYIGYILDGKRHGQGTYIWPDGRKYVGEWRENRAIGGWFYRTNGQKVWVYQDAEGKWVVKEQ